MAEDLLDRIQREIRERKEAARPAYEESRRLQAVLDALGPPDTAPDAAHKPRVARHARRRSSPPAKPPATRAPRGENRRRILEVLAERPGTSAGEVAQVSGIARPTVASTLAKLASERAVQRVERPAGGVGFRLADRNDDQRDSTPTEVDADTGTDDARVDEAPEAGNAS